LTARRGFGWLPAAAGFGLIAAATAATVVLAAGAFADDGPGREEYLNEVSVICDRYGKQLDLIPPYDAASPGDTYEKVGKALPILEAELAEVRAVRPPAAMTKEVERFVELSEQSIAELRKVRAQAVERDIYGVAVAFTRFEKVRNRAQAEGREIGFRCSGGES
jgi:hypothetical protein